MVTSLARKSVPMLPLAELQPSPLNPRKTFRKLEELADSIRQVGILQPLLVRPLRSGPTVRGWEVVAGERRRRAAELAGLTEVPVNMRELSDEEVVDLQLVENDQREDVQPIEQAEAYQAQIDRGRSVAEIAARTGRSETYVRNRLQLTTLHPALRLALEFEMLTFTGAIAAATLGREDQAYLYNQLCGDFGWPEPELDEEGAEESIEALRAEWERPLVSAGVAGVLDIRDRMRHRALELGRALFEMDDAELVPSAGACTRCPKRTCAQVELFGEPVPGDDDRCLDRDCYQRKQDAAWVKRSAAAKSAGLKVLEGPEAEKLAPHGHLRYGDPDFISLDDHSPILDGEDEDGEGRELTWREAFAREGLAAPVSLLRSGDTILELVERSAVEGLAKKSEAARAVIEERTHERSAGSNDDWKKRQKAAEQKAKIDAEAKRRVIAAIVAASTRESPTIETRIALVETAAHVVHEQVRKDVMKARGWQVEKVDGDRFATEHCIAREARDLDALQLVGLLVELLATGAGEYSSTWADKGRPIASLAAALNVSIEHHKREAKAALKSKKKSPKTAARKRSKAAPAPEPGVCRECGCTEEEACEGGCVWVDATKTLCSSCAEVG